MLFGMAVHDTGQNNRTWMTEQTLWHLGKTVDMEKHRVIAVDNGSTPMTKVILASYKWLTVITLPENIGTANAVNLAWRQRRPGEHCVKMDNDVTIAKVGWADMIEDVFRRDPSIGICGLKRNDLMQSTYAEGDYVSTIRELSHERGERWLYVEETASIMGTCQGFNSALLDKIGYLTQPNLYGYDDCLASIRSEVAGFKNVFLVGVEIDHIDPGGTDYNKWKHAEAARALSSFNTQVLMYRSGVQDVYSDGGFTDDV